MHVGQHPSQSSIGAASVATAADDRRAVKEIARDVEKQLGKLARVPVFSRDVDRLDRIVDRLTSDQEKLAALRRRSLSEQPPAATAMRSARSSALLASAALTRAGAVAAAGAVAVVEGGTAVVASPVMGTINGALGGLQTGWDLPVYCAKPATALGGFGIGAALGAVKGSLGAVVAGPVAIGMPASYTRTAFGLVDQMPKARAHAARKKMSTREIASDARRKLDNALDAAEEKRNRAAFFNGAPAALTEIVATMLGSGQ